MLCWPSVLHEQGTSDIEESDSLSLNFATYSELELGVIDLDNADYSDLSLSNAIKKAERDKKTSSFLLPDEVFVKNRTVSKENQEKLLRTLMEDSEYRKYKRFFTQIVPVEDFLKFGWMKKILDTFCTAQLISSGTSKRYTAIALSYYRNGFRGILEYEIKKVKSGETKTVDKAYAEAFESLRGILEHRIPKIISLFESIIAYVAEQKGDDTSFLSLSPVRRYYETGVKSALGEALIEYGFPTDAVRRIEETHHPLCGLSVDDAKQYCRNVYSSIKALLDPYENRLFINAMNSF